MPARLFQPAWIISALSALVVVGMMITDRTEYIGIVAVTFFVALAFAFSAHSTLRTFAFTAWVIACVSTGITYPGGFQYWGEFDLRRLITPLNQIIMFGMGTTLALRDFIRVATFPWPVGIGIFLQFAIMPISGYIIATQGNFDPEVAAGIILIGVFSGGLASNLMTYLAKGNVALSVSMTAVSTFCAPFVTPHLMYIFAGEMIPVDRWAMMLSILNIVIVPVVAGLFAHSIIYSRKPWAHSFRALGVITAGSLTSAGLVIFSILQFPAGLGAVGTLRAGVALGLCMIAIVALSKAVITLRLGVKNWIDHALPITAMAAICMVLTIIAAHGRDDLMLVGGLLVIAAVVHNAVGYSLGYWCSRTFGYALGWVGYKVGYYPTLENQMEEQSCRTVAFEVGMQNAGAAVGVANEVLQSARAALAPGVFGIWMNVSGSMLANWWQRKPLADARIKEPEAATVPAPLSAEST